MWYGRQAGQVYLSDRKLRVKRPRLRKRSFERVVPEMADAVGISKSAVSRGKSWVPPVVGGVGGLLVPTGVFLAIFCSDPDTSCDGENVLIATALIGVPPGGIGTLVGLLLQDERWEPVPVDAFTAHIGPGGIGFGVSLAW